MALGVEQGLRGLPVYIRMAVTANLPPHRCRRSVGRHVQQWIEDCETSEPFRRITATDVVPVDFFLDAAERGGLGQIRRGLAPEPAVVVGIRRRFGKERLALGLGTVFPEPRIIHLGKAMIGPFLKQPSARRGVQGTADKAVCRAKPDPNPAVHVECLESLQHVVFRFGVIQVISGITLVSSECPTQPGLGAFDLPQQARQSEAGSLWCRP